MKKRLLSVLFAVLVPSFSEANCSYELFNITTSKETRIIDFIDQLSDECELSIVITDQYAEKYLETKLNKTHIKNLTIDEVFNIILNENNLSYSLKNNILKISYLTTKIFNIDYILSQRIGKGSTDITLSSQSDKSSSPQGQSSGGNSSNSQSGIKIENTDEVKFWLNLDKEFRKVINMPQDEYAAPKPIINRNAGLVTVTATDKQMKRFSKYLEKLQKKVQLQVLIDVQILSVTMSDSKTTGIDWNQLYALQNVELSINTKQTNHVDTYYADKSIKDTAVDTGKALASVIDMKAGGSLNEVIKFLKTQGDVNSISNPKVLTLNNQPALITSGTEYFYKISSTETLGNAGGGTQSSNENIQSVFAGVLLSITPEIADDDTITLIINPSLSETNNDITQETNAGRSMPPDLNRRQLSSVVTVKDGHKIILGGLISTKVSTRSNKVPLLGDIPLISGLFSYEENVKNIQELVIIVEPHIIKKENKSISLSKFGYKGLDMTSSVLK